MIRPEPEPSSDAGSQSGLIESAKLQILALRDRGGTSLHVTPHARGFLNADSFPGYKIGNEVHRGGQGVVYQAVQSSTGRTVAIKVMRNGPWTTANQTLRMQREAQILGSLNHPNIVGIIDSGSSADHQYVVMDYVDGQPLDVHVGGLTLRAILQLFSKVADAVHAAHLRGIIHRDLKPSNVLVDSEGSPFILDFGLARLVAPDPQDPSFQATVTITGQFVGSLPWASPEQAAGRGIGDDHAIDIRSDVYSLGVMMYQALAGGAFPYRVIGSMHDVLDNIINAVPAAPSGINREIDDEVETIVLKCLSKEPARRYQSAGELARDLRHYLADEPIEAKRDSFAYVVRKQLHRHRAAVAVAAAIVLLIAGGLIASLTLWRTAVLERNEKESQRSRAESVNTILHNMLASANPETTSGHEITVADVLTGAASEIDAGSLRDHPDVEASIRLTLGESYLAMGKLDPASHHLQRALELSQQAHGDNDPITALCLTALGRLELERANFSQAIAHHEQALRILQAAEQPRYEIPWIMMDLAWAMNRMSRREEAHEVQQQALALITQQRGERHPQTARMKVDVAAFMLGPDEAIPLLQQALNDYRSSLGPTHPEVVRTLRRLADEFHKGGRIRESETTYLEALNLCEQLYGPVHPEILTIVKNLAWLYEYSDQGLKRAPLLRKYQASALATYGRESLPYAGYLCLLGQAVSLEKPEEGEAMVRDALDTYKRLGGGENWHAAECRVQLAQMSLARGESELAEQLALETLALDGSDDRVLVRQAKAKGTLGEILTNRGEFEDAQTLLLECYEIFQHRRTYAPSTALAATRLVNLYDAWNVADRAAGKDIEAQKWRAVLAQLPPVPAVQSSKH